MPWVPEVFSAPVQERLKRERRRETLLTVPYFEGVMAGETNALIESFAGKPELHHPVRGRIRDVRGFETYVNETIDWLTERNATVEEVGHIGTPRQGFEEVVLHLDGDTGRIELPVAIVADHRSHGRLDELRIYYSTRPLIGRHANRPPLLQPDPELREYDAPARGVEGARGGNPNDGRPPHKRLSWWAVPLHRRARRRERRAGRRRRFRADARVGVRSPAAIRFCS
jgi:hypothetical protein